MFDMSYKEYMGETFKIWLNEILITDYFHVLEVTGRSLSPNEVKKLTVPGMPGSHLQSKRKPGAPLGIKGFMIYSNDTELRQAVDELNGLIDTEEAVPIVFSDEPDKTYYVMFNDVSEGIEVNGKHIFTITFVRFDPYKYGPEKSVTLNSNAGTIINVEGTAPTKPIFEFDVLAPITFAMVSNGDEYMMIGNPTAVTETPVNKEPKVFHHAMENKIGWVSTNVIADGYINGSMEFDSTGFYPVFAEPTKAQDWHGPALKHSLSRPVQDFRAEAWFRYFARDGGSVGRIETYGLDASNNIVFRAWIEDKWYGADHIGVGLELGNGDKTEYFILPRGLEQFYGRLKVIKKGNEWTVLVQKNKSFNDDNQASLVEREWSRTIESDINVDVSQIQLAFQKFYDQTGDNMEVFSMRLYELLSITGPAYIAQPGDKILFDFKNHDIRINGEQRKDLKDRGAKPFDLLPGYNTLALLPDGDVSGKVKFRPAYK